MLLGGVNNYKSQMIELTKYIYGLIVSFELLVSRCYTTKCLQFLEETLNQITLFHCCPVKKFGSV